MSAFGAAPQRGVPRPNSAGTHHGPCAGPRRAASAIAPSRMTGQLPSASTPICRSHVVMPPALGTNPSSA